MALKAGRVGVAPDQVDDFGKVKSDATSSYTKQEADAKFETQTAAAAALAEKQPIQLSVPLELLTGSALTVEDALNGINNEVTESVTAQITSEVGTFAVRSLMKVGKVVCLTFNLTLTQNITAWDSVIISVPEEFKAPAYFAFIGYNGADSCCILQATVNGKEFQCSKTLASGALIRGTVCYIS